MRRSAWLVTALGYLLATAMAAQEPNKLSYVDLQPKANHKLTEDIEFNGPRPAGNNLAALPRGEQILKGVKFNIGDGFLLLRSKLFQSPKPNRFEGIEVGRTFARLHILHSTQYGGFPGNSGQSMFVPDDTQIAKYVVHYDDGSTATIPILFGDDVRMWWFALDEKTSVDSKVAWIGENEATGAMNTSKIRLFIRSWNNPTPDKRVVSIDFAKTGDAPTAPFCVAMTLEQ